MRGWVPPTLLHFTRGNLVRLCPIIFDVFPNDLNIWMGKGAMKNLFPIKPKHIAIYMAIFLLKRCKCLCWVHGFALEIHNQFLSSLCYCKIRYILNQGACRQGDWNFCSHIVRTNNVWIRLDIAWQHNLVIASLSRYGRHQKSQTFTEN